jgi:hypothetical protein
VWLVPLAQVLSHPQLILPSKTCFFGIYLNFQQQKSLKNHISHILNPNLTKKISLNPTHQDLSFQQHQRHIPIPPKFSALI